LNKQVEVSVDTERYSEAKRAFKRLEQEQQELGYELVWFIVDGFVLYWDKVSPDRAE
jgi:nicotinamide/nicotinate riboside kinase